MTKTKKIILVLLTTLTLLRVLYICIGSDIDKTIFKSCSIDLSDVAVYPCINLEARFVGQKNRLHGINLIFTGVPSDTTGYITIQISSNKELIYQTNIALANIINGEWKFVYMNIALNDGEEYVLHLNSSNDCVQIPNVVITPNESAAPETLESYFDNNLIDGQIGIEYEYFQIPTVSDRLIMSSIWILCLMTTYIIILHWDMILKQFNAMYQFFHKQIKFDIFILLMELFCYTIILKYSGIEFQYPTKILLLLISFFAVIKPEPKQEYIHEITDTKIKQIALYLLYIYAGFSLVGQRILIYPLTSKIRVTGIFVFVVSILWFVPIIKSMLYIMGRSEAIIISEKPKLKQLSFIVLILCLLFIPACYALYAFNPGISSSDTYSCMVINAHNLRGMYDWHSAFYCIILRAILTLWDSTYAVIIAQYFFWGYVFVELFLYLRKRGITDSILLASALFMGINAGNFLHLNTIWKDIPYAISLVWILVLLAKLSFDFETYRKTWYIFFEIIVALIGIFFYRKNGIVPFLLISAMMIIILHKSLKIWLTLIITAMLIIVIKGPIYNYLEIQDPGTHGMYIGLGQDILGVYYSNGEVSQSTLSMINTMTSYNNAEYEYTPTWSKQAYDLDVTPTEFVLNYIDTFIKNPMLLIRAVIARVDAIWNIYAGADAYLGCVNNYNTMDGRENWNDYYPERVHNSLYEIVATVTDYTANTQWISSIEWRSGLLTLLGFSAFVFAFLSYNFKKYVLILSPIIGQSLSLLLSTGWSDFRYFWPLNLMNFVCILLIATIPKSPRVNNYISE